MYIPIPTYFPVVEGVVLEENIGYIELATFDEGCAEQFKTAYEELKNKNVKSLIIDLRNNGGAVLFLSAVINIVESLSKI